MGTFSREMPNIMTLKPHLQNPAIQLGLYLFLTYTPKWYHDKIELGISSVVTE